MAKYTVNYTCGHEDRIELFGATKVREATIARKEKELCPKCRAEKAVEKSEKQGFVALEGSDKQVSWASDIRIKRLPELQAEAEKAAKQIEAAEEAMKGEDKIAEVASKTGKTKNQIIEEATASINKRKVIIKKYEMARTTTSAKWWIEEGR